MPQASTTIRKLIAQIVAQHPGWSTTRIAADIEQTKPNLVDKLFRERRAFIWRWWVTDTVGGMRREHRDAIKTGDMLAALSPTGDRKLVELGEMTGIQVVDLGERYVLAGDRLSKLGYTYIKLGEYVGRRKVKTVKSDPTVQELLEQLRSDDA